MGRRRPLGSPTLILLLAAVILILIPLRHKDSVKFFFIQVFAPLQKAAYSSVAKVKNIKDGMRAYLQEHADYQRLLEKVQALENQVFELQEVASENRRLTDLIEFKKSLAYDSIAARVIGWDTNAWAASVIIDKGHKDGVGDDMAVVFERGLVGRVIESRKTVSRVLLITDPKNKIGARMQRTREIGVVQGASTYSCKITYMSKFADVQKNDVVVTSGISAIYPKGIPIGQITEIYADDNELYKYSYLKPVVNFSQLEEVVVLRWKQ